MRGALKHWPGPESLPGGCPWAGPEVRWEALEALDLEMSSSEGGLGPRAVAWVCLGSGQEGATRVAGETDVEGNTPNLGHSSGLATRAPCNE